MTGLAWALAAPAGALGALARHGTGRLIAHRLGAGAPWGVLAANLLGAFLLGLLVGAAPGDDLVLVLGAGFLGSYTTFSTWMVETDALALRGRYAGALLNVVGPAIGGLMLAAVGFAAGMAVA
jgi:CrcB protein